MTPIFCSDGNRERGEVQRQKHVQIRRRKRREIKGGKKEKFREIDTKRKKREGQLAKELGKKDTEAERMIKREIF